MTLTLDAPDEVVAPETLDTAGLLARLPRVVQNRVDTLGDHLIFRGPMYSANGGRQFYARTRLTSYSPFVYVHKLAWEIVNGETPQRLTRTCDQPRCIAHWAKRADLSAANQDVRVRYRTARPVEAHDAAFLGRLQRTINRYFDRRQQLIADVQTSARTAEPTA